MSDSPGPAHRYHVSYSERVREETRRLILRAKDIGKGKEVLNAVKTIDERLQVYPQFGEPLRDLVLEPAQLWIAVVPPLVVQYVIDDERKLVMVPVPFCPLPNSGLQ